MRREDLQGDGQEGNVTGLPSESSLIVEISWRSSSSRTKCLHPGLKYSVFLFCFDVQYIHLLFPPKCSDVLCNILKDVISTLMSSPSDEDVCDITEVSNVIVHIL